MGDIKSEEEAVDPGGDLCPLEFFPNELFLNVYKVAGKKYMYCFFYRYYTVSDPGYHRHLDPHFLLKRCNF